MRTCKLVIRSTRRARTPFNTLSFKPVAHMDGCFASVMGLPVCHVIRLMRQDGYPARRLIFSFSCETLLEYKCPVSNAILE